MARWTPMARAELLPLHPTRRRALERWAACQGFSEEEVADVIAAETDAEAWTNALYTATVHPTAAWLDGWPSMKRLSIRRIDRRAIHDWRHLQRIKSDIFGPEAEAVELYPSERRVVDTANSFHLWVLEPPGTLYPFGWPRGLRGDEDGADIPGQQRRGSRP